MMREKTLQLILELLFPPLCVVCRKRQKKEHEYYLCEACREKIAIFSHPFCAECGSRVPGEEPGRTTGEEPGRTTGEEPGRTTCGEPGRTTGTRPRCHPASFLLCAASSYENGVVRELLHVLKYQRLRNAMLQIKEFIIKPYVEKIIAHSSLVIGHCTLVPIPLHPRKERSRGFNQAELIARALAECLGEVSPISPISPIGPISPIRLIKRVRNTRTQTELPDHKARKENIKNCFQVIGHSSLVIGHSNTIILVDDVYTSGATMKEAVRVMRAIKPKTQIIGFVVART